MLKPREGEDTMLNLILQLISFAGEWQWKGEWQWNGEWQWF